MELRSASTTLALPLAIGLFAGGGFDDLPRALFTGAAGLALVVAIADNEKAAREVATAPALLALLALAALSVLSAIWTVDDPGAAIRWGLVLAGYAAVAVAAAVVWTRSPLAVCALVAGLVTACGILGLLAAAAGALEPLAERIGGTWRPGGTLEYPPALAVCEVAVLPIVARGMIAARGSVAAASALAAVIAVAVVALADSRVGLVLVLVAACVVLARPVSRPQRFATWAATAHLVGSAAVVHLLFGGLADGGERGAGDAALLASLLLGSAAIWPRVRSGAMGLAARGSAPGPGRVAPAMGLRPAAVAAAVAAAGVMLVAGTPEGGGIERASGFTHGREHQWEAAVEVAARRPLIGAGAEAYFAASAAEQGRFPLLYAHSLPLEVAAELGLLGFGLVLALYTATGLAVFRVRGSETFWLLAPAALALPLASLVDWSWHLAGAGAVWSVALGAILAAGARRASVSGAG